MVATYRDMTFCTNKKCKKECRRKLTEDVKNISKIYKIPLALADFDCEDEDYLEEH